MRKAFKNVFGQNTDKAEAASVIEGTAVIATGATPLAQKPDLYSTKGSIGIEVVAEPTDAVLEYVQNLNCFIYRRDY